MAATALQPTRAEAAPSLHDNVIEVVGTSEGFTAPSGHAAGHLTFKVSTSHSAGGLFALLELRRGADLDEVLEGLMLGITGDRAESVAGGRAVQRQAELLGGAAVQPVQPVAFTSLLTPGDYFLINYQDLREGGIPQAADRLRSLTITSQWSNTPPPRATATAVFTLSDSRAAFRMPTMLRRGSLLRMVNAMPQLGEAVFMPVVPGTTRDTLQEFFEAANREDWSVPFPFIGDPLGVPALSPGHTTIVDVGLAPGEYALVTWYPNFDDSTMLAAQGQFQLVRIV